MSVILTDAPIVEIDGRKMQLQRLTVNAVFRCLKIVQKIGIGKTLNLVQTYTEIETAKNDDGSKLTDEQKQAKIFGAVGVLLESAIEAEEEVCAFGASVLGVSTKEFAALPFDAILAVVIGLKDHPDLAAFSNSLLKLMGAEIKKTAPNTVPNVN